MPKSRLSVAAYLALVFLGGALVGGFSNRLYMNRSTGGPPRSPDEWRKRYVAEMRDRVKLDDAQVASLQGILDETRQRFHQMREQEKSAAQAIQNEQIQKIRAMLRPEQQKAYDEFRAERERRRQEGERRDGGRKGPPPGR